jgi:hypothetical protein
MIHVCSLARLHDTVAATGARHVVSLVAREDAVKRPAAVAICGCNCTTSANPSMATSHLTAATWSG